MLLILICVKGSVRRLCDSFGSLEEAKKHGNIPMGECKC